MGAVAGLHFFNPVDRMELVEVVRTEACEEDVIRRLLEFVRSLGKTPIVTSDKPGFLVNRVLFPYLGEAVRMVSEGHSAAQLDRELCRFGMPMGPLELIDQVGVDIASHVAKSLGDVQPDSIASANLLQDMAGHGWLGKKANRGFYEYRDGKRHGENSAIVSGRRPKHPAYEFIDDGLTDVQRRLVYPILNEAVHCLDELVVSDAWIVDLGMVLGTGFAPMRGGPLRMIDTLGIRTVQHNLTGLMQLYGERFKPADGIQRLSRSKALFFERSVSTDLNPQLAPSSS
jgi:3-hydroxyacyl-CoA dehydrogenase